MKRVTLMTGTYYGIELPEDDRDALQEIREFAEQGTPVIICEEYSDLEDLDIFEDEITMVEREDD